MKLLLPRSAICAVMSMTLCSSIALKAQCGGKDVAYRIEQPKNAEVIVIHLNCRISDGIVLSAFTLLDDQPTLMRDLLRTEGVTQVILNQYAIDVYKGEMFSWKALLPKLLTTIRARVVPGHLVEYRGLSGGRSVQ